MLNDTWYSRDLQVLTAIAEKLERGSAPVDTEQLINELGLIRQDLTEALRALDVEDLIVRWPSGSRTAAASLRLSWSGSPRELVRRLVCGRQLRPVRLRSRGPGHDQIKRPRTGAIRDVQRSGGFHGPTPPRRSSVILVTYPGGGSGIPGKMTSGPR